MTAQVDMHELNDDQFELIIHTEERDAIRWMYIEILERDGVARKCEVMNEINERLLPIRELMQGVPFSADNQNDLRLYHARIGSISQFLDYDNGNGNHDLICRQTGGVNGMLSFKEGGCETAKAKWNYNTEGIAFLNTLKEVTTDQVGANFNNDPVDAIVEPIAAANLAETPEPVSVDPSEWMKQMQEQLDRIEAKIDQLEAAK